MWQAGSSHSRWKNETPFENSLPRVSLASWCQRGLRFGKPRTCSMMPGALRSLSFDHFGTRGVSPTLLATRLEMPVTCLANRLIMNVTEPRQCAITCSGRVPMCSRTIRTAGG